MPLTETGNTGEITASVGERGTELNALRFFEAVFEAPVKHLFVYTV